MMGSGAVVSLSLAVLLLAASATPERSSRRVVRRLPVQANAGEGQETSGQRSQRQFVFLNPADNHIFQARADSSQTSPQTVWVQVPANALLSPTFYQYPGQPSNPGGPIIETPPIVPQPFPPPTKPPRPGGNYPPAGIPEQPSPPESSGYPGQGGYPGGSEPVPTSPPILPDPDPAKEALRKACLYPRGQFPSPNACNKFVNCWDGEAVEQECPGDLLFNPKGFCDFPENVACGDRPSYPKPDQPGTSKPPQPGKNACASPFDKFRDPSKCGTFYVCVNSKPFEFQCPPGLDYSIELGVCDYPQNVDCGAAESSGVTPPPPDNGGDGSYPGDGGDGDNGSYPGNGGDGGQPGNGGDGGQPGNGGNPPDNGGYPGTGGNPPPSGGNPPASGGYPPVTRPPGGYPRPPSGYPQRYFYAPIQLVQSSQL